MEKTTKYNKGDHFRSYLPFIESRFPAVYREKYPILIEFLEAYYEWLEQEKGAGDRLLSYELFKDSDYGANEFIENFRSELMPFFPASTIVDNSLLVKKINDFYRSKGKPKSLQFLFRVLFNQDAQVDFPDDRIIFQEANQSNTDVIMRINYTDAPATTTIPFKNFIGKKIKGNDSNGTALVIDANEFQIGTTVFVELSLANASTQPFYPNEIITTQSTETLIGRVYGVISATNITSGGSDYELNSAITFSDEGDGKGVSAIVSKVTGGVSTINVTDGGAGYSELDVLTVNITPAPLGSGSGATATAVVSAGRVAQINVTSPGSGYDYGVEVSISGGSYTRLAKAEGLTKGEITGITFLDPGVDYNITPPTANFEANPPATGGSAGFIIGPIATVLPRIIRYRGGNNDFPEQNYNVLLVLGGGSGVFDDDADIYQYDDEMNVTWTGKVVSWDPDERRLIIQKNTMLGFSADRLIHQLVPGSAIWSYDSPYSTPIRLDAGDDELNREYTYTIKSVVPVADYAKYVKDNVHPSGMRFSGLFEVIGEVANISTLLTLHLFKDSNINDLNASGVPRFLTRQISFGWHSPYAINMFNPVYGQISDIEGSFQDLNDTGTVKDLKISLKSTTLTIVGGAAPYVFEDAVYELGVYYP